ncbi:unnamed protein product [Mytilus coruscus]|uniref:Uncharacterized protein n=1 Tax=Mytilus coruscus TaxID=42192 RepID=A0A6J8EM70_MYTCO|nr:unnamed protein product [Mytilus coruscus]
MDREKKENGKIFQRKIYREKRSLKRKLQTKYSENNIRISLQTCSTIFENRQKLNGYMYEAQNSKFDFRSLLGLLAVLDHLECSTLIEFQDAFEIYSSFFEHQPDKNVFQEEILDVDKRLVCCYFMHPFDKVTYISLRTPDVPVERIIFQIFTSIPEKGEIIPTFSAETVEKILHSMDSKRKLGAGPKEEIDEEDEDFLLNCIESKATAHGRRHDSVLYLNHSVRKRDFKNIVNHFRISQGKQTIKSSTTVYNRGRPKNTRTLQAKKHKGKWLFSSKKPTKSEEKNRIHTKHQRAHVKRAVIHLCKEDQDLALIHSMDDKAYLKPEASDGLDKFKVFQTTDSDKQRKLPKYDFAQAKLNITPSSHRFIMKDITYVDNNLEMVMSEDENICVFRPKFYIGSSGTVWASEDRKLRYEKPQLYERKAETTQLSNEFHSIAALIRDKAKHYSLQNVLEDVNRVTANRDCPFKAFEQIKLDSLFLHIEQALKLLNIFNLPEKNAYEKQCYMKLYDITKTIRTRIESTKEQLGDIETSEDVQELIENVAHSCTQLLNMLNEFELKKTKPRVLELTDGDPGFTGQLVNDVERTQAAVGKGISDGGSIHWEYKQLDIEDNDIKQMTIDEIEKTEDDINKFNVTQTCKDLAMRVENSPGPRGGFMTGLVYEDTPIEIKGKKIKPDDFQPRCQVRILHNEGEIKSDMSNEIQSFAEKHAVEDSSLIKAELHHIELIKFKREKRSEFRKLKTQFEKSKKNDDWTDLHLKGKIKDFSVNLLAINLTKESEDTDDDDDVMSDVSEEDLVIREIGSDRDESGDEELMRLPAEKVNRYERVKLQSHRLGEVTEKCQKFCQNCDENEVIKATRQWDIQSRMKKLEGSVNFIIGTNPNAVGSFIHGEILKPGQNKILDNNIKKLNTNYASLDELKVEVKDNECEIYDQTGRTLLKEQFTVQHAFNLQMLILLSQLHDRIKEVLQKCDKLRQKYIQLFGGKGRVGRTEIGIRRKKTGHNRKKAIKRNLKHLFKQCSVLKKELCPNITVSNDEFSLTSNINGLQDICKNKVENETNNIDIDQVCNIGVNFAKPLFVLFEKKMFSHTQPSA